MSMTHSSRFRTGAVLGTTLPLPKEKKYSKYLYDFSIFYKICFRGLGGNMALMTLLNTWSIQMQIRFQLNILLLPVKFDKFISNNFYCIWTWQMYILYLGNFSKKKIQCTLDYLWNRVAWHPWISEFRG